MLLNQNWCCSPAKENPLKEFGLSDSRKRIWELEHYYFCSVIGTCLSPSELRRLVKKSRMNTTGITTDYELHQLVVNSVGEETARIAQQVTRHLDKKYKAAIQASLKLESSRELETYWKRESKTTSLHGAYWALITHPLASSHLCQSAYGHVHMLSHLLGESVRDQEQKITVLKKQHDMLETRYRKSLLDNRERLKNKNSEIESLKRQIANQPSEVPDNDKSLKLRIAAEDLTALLNMERLKCERVEDELQLARSATARLQDKLSEMRDQLDVYRSRETFRDEDVNAINEAPEEVCNDIGDEELINSDLCGRCILYVGGRTRQCGRFKQIVQKRNGKFIHHDGGLEDTNNRLDAILAKADAIMCPLDCVSHNAINKAKKYCKNRGKPLIFLEKSSLAAFEAGLGKVSEL